MIFKSLFLTLLFLSCSHQPTVTKEKKISQKEKNFDLLAKRTECIKRIKYYKLLATQIKQINHHEWINHTTISLCSTKLNQITNYFDQHSNKIGLIIQSGDTNHIRAKAIIDGIKESYKKISKKQDIDFIIAKKDLNKKELNQAMAKLVLNHKVGLIISWGENRFVKHIQKWQNKLEIPGLFITNHIKTDNQSFKVFPSRKNYVIELIKNLKLKKIQKLAILTPDYIKETPLLKLIKKALPASGIAITHDIEYSYNEYQTYDFACKKLFEIDPIKRKEELELIYVQEELKAQASGYNLDPRHVFLPAKINFDAVLIPDNFKTVLQFTKLFKYYKASNIDLIGTYQWRSEDLLIPKEEYLNGASFVDFLGDYRNLPFKVTQKDSSYRIDYKLMGYYTGILAQKAVLKSNQSKNSILKELRNIKINDKFMSNKKAFTNNAFNWPSFSVNVYNNKFFIQDLHH